MHEALESRHVIEELKAHNEKLQRDIYALSSNMSLLHECLGELKIVDRVGDVMQKKIHAFQLAQHARANVPASSSTSSVLSPRAARRLSDPNANTLDDDVICGSSAFHHTAAYSSSYESQIARDTFNRKNMFAMDADKDKVDIFGHAKAVVPPPLHEARRGDSIDSLLSSGCAARHYSQQDQAPPMAISPYGPR